MNQIKTEAKEAIRATVELCFTTWILNKQDMLEILISIAGDLATEKATQQGVVSDVLSCGHSEGVEYGESSWKCVVCGQPARRTR